MPAGQERVVIARSGNRCAYPVCGVDLVIEPQTTADRPKAVGKVAHIAAASPGGPRYDENMTHAQRGAANNLIYLCGPHHDAIDSQLDLHTTAYLTEAKESHEAAVARAVRVAIGRVSYKELLLVCEVITDGVSSSSASPVELALPVQAKILINELGERPTRLIQTGLSQAARVADFISFQAGSSPEFGRRLADRFRADYFQARAEGLTSDEIFDVLVGRAYDNAGFADSPETRAAALAVIAYLFEICELFERA